MNGRVVEVVTAYPKQYKNTVKKDYSPISPQIEIYVSEDKKQMERRL